jgi:hypothetical protein
MLDGNFHEMLNVSTHLEADGCVLEWVEEVHRLTTPDHLRVGDTR